MSGQEAVGGESSFYPVDSSGNGGRENVGAPDPVERAFLEDGIIALPKDALREALDGYLRTTKDGEWDDYWERAGFPAVDREKARAEAWEKFKNLLVDAVASKSGSQR